METSALALEDLRIASPCGVSWEDMRPVGDGGRVRHCEHCALNVYNLAEMERDQATALIRGHEGGRVCIRMLKRADGTVITADCPVGLARVRRRLQRIAAGVAALLGLAGVAAAIETMSSRDHVASASSAAPFSWVSKHLYGKAQPQQTTAFLTGAVCVPRSPANATPVTVNGVLIRAPGTP